MYNEKVDNKLLEIATSAIRNDRFFEYLWGVGEYKFTILGNANFCDMNDATVAIKGFELYHRVAPEFDIKLYIEKSLIAMLNSLDYRNFFIAVDFIRSYAYLDRTKQLSFSIDIFPVMDQLCSNLYKVRAELMQEMVLGFDNHTTLWEHMESDLRFIKHYTGYEIPCNE